MKLNVGTCYEKRITISDELIKQFAELSNDYNPIHMDKTYAEQSRFKRRIAHGMLVGALLSGILGAEFPGEGTIYLAQSFEFKKPVYVDECVLFRLKITDIFDDKKIAIIETNIVKDNDEIAVVGEAKVMFD